MWTYAPDTSRQGFNDTDYKEGQARLTWQVAPRHKVAFSDEEQVICRCGSGVSATVSPEAAQNTVVPIERIAQADWSAPWTSRLLSEGTFLYRTERWGLRPPIEFAGGGQQIMVTDTGGALEPISNLSYHGGQAGGSLPLYNSQWVPNIFYRFSTSYVTGSHSVKFGVNDTIGSNNINVNAQYPYSYTFTNTKPVSITEYAAPYSSVIHQDHDFGLFVQDRWTINRLTLSGGVRYDYYKSSYPQQSAGPTQLAPNRNITFPAQDNISWKDVTPRMGAVYDLTGNGKTAVRVSLNKYLAGQVLVGLPVNANPINTLVNSASRNWTDANSNYIPDCNLANPVANGECGALNNPNFGSAIPGTQYDPNLLSGWGKRNYNWEFSAGVQRELLPRVSLDVAYFRRWFGNFMATDNLALSAASFTPFTYVAPADSRLPNGGGYSIPGLVDYASNAAFLTPTQNLVTLASNYGKQIQHWNGVDITMNARLPQGAVVQGGVSTCRQITDACAIAAALPESLITGTTYTPQSYCHQEQPFLTQVKFLAIYRVPKIDAQLSATYQNLPGVAIAANQVVTTATLAASTLGRPLSGSVKTATINLVQPLSSYGERLSQLDMRFSKIVKFGGRAVTANVDLYNALNANTVLSENAAYRDTTATGFRVPTAILQARLVKFSAQFDF